ncbi:unnamed protein product [Calypogeia fissa]
MAAVMEVGAAAMMACSTSSTATSRLSQRGAVCSSSPSRLMSGNGSTSFSRAVLPTRRGLKLSFGASAGRLRATAVRVPKQKGVVCEASETAVGAPPMGVAGEVSDVDFKRLVLDSDVPVLVDFWAPWCGPCRMISPIIDDLAKKYAGELRCVKLNTDESPYTATEYGIRSIPTVMIFKGGEKMDTVIGAVPLATLTATVEKYIKS